MNPLIGHDPEQHRFFYRIDGKEGSVEYEMKDTGAMNVYRTFVHEDLRGKGIAEQLMTGAYEFAREKGLRIFPSCEYAIGFFKRHPEYAAILAADANLESGGSCRV